MISISSGLRALLFTLPAVLAAPKTTTTSTPIYNCTTFVVPIPVSNVTTIVPPFPYPFPNGYAATLFANSATDRTQSTVKPQLAKVTKTFNVSVEYCTSKSIGAKASTVQLLTHGLGFDKSYWDFHLPKSSNNTYSYINAALTAGYSTLAWDRLGCGASSIADPYTEIQSTVELTILTELTALLRQSKLSSYVPTPKKVIHVGHSWGSQLTNALVATTPTLSDGVVLTGYSHLSNYQPLFIASTNFHLASTNQPKRFKTRSTGYLTWADQYANQYAFFNYPYFDPTVLQYAESQKHPFTVGEFISSTAISYNATLFKGPVLYLVGQEDLIYCASDCEGLFKPTSEAVTTFNASSSVESYIQPNTGHGINLHYNATAAFAVVMDWAGRHGF